MGRVSHFACTEGRYLGVKGSPCPGSMFFPTKGGYLLLFSLLASAKLFGAEGSYLGMKGNTSHPVSVPLPTHDEVPPGQVPHLPGLIIAACHLCPSHICLTSPHVLHHHACPKDAHTMLFLLLLLHHARLQATLLLCRCHLPGDKYQCSY